MGKYSWVRSWWWPVLFCAVVGGLYVERMRTRHLALQEVAKRLSEIEAETLAVMKEKEILALSLASQSDPAWIELVLLRQMGVVPEGFLKVHFKR